MIRVHYIFLLEVEQTVEQTAKLPPCLFLCVKGNWNELDLFHSQQRCVISDREDTGDEHCTTV